MINMHLSRLAEQQRACRGVLSAATLTLEVNSRWKLAPTLEMSLAPLLVPVRKASTYVGPRTINQHLLLHLIVRH